MILTVSLSQTVFAGTCETYEDLPYAQEVTAGDIKQIGRAIENRKNGDKVYLGCSAERDGECIRITSVLEAVSCASKEAPRFFELNTKIDIVDVPEGRLSIRMHYKTRSELELPKQGYNYFYFTYMDLLLAGENSVYAIALPLTLAADVALLPYRAVKNVVDRVSYKVVMSKMNRSQVVSEVAVGLKPMKMKNRHFENMLHTFAYISQGL